MPRVWFEVTGSGLRNHRWRRGRRLRGLGRASRVRRGLARWSGRAAAAATGFAASFAAALVAVPNRFSSSSRTGRRYSLWHFGLQTFSQQTGSQHGLAQQPFSQQGFAQHFGAQQAFSQQGFSQQRTLWQHFGSQQVGSGQQPLASQQAGSHWQPLASNKSLMLANKSRTGVGRHTFTFANRRASRQAGLLTARLCTTRLAAGGDLGASVALAAATAVQPKHAIQEFEAEPLAAQSYAHKERSKNHLASH